MSRRSTRPRVAVITPYYKEPLALLEQCHQSVLAQTEPCLHVLVADGHPRKGINRWDADHVRLPRSHGDIGSTPRLIGCYHAIGLGVEAVAFLDADNWYGPDHIAAAITAMDQTDAAFVSTGRTLCRLDGSVMGLCPLSHPDRFIDTNAMLFGRAAFPLLQQWVLMCVRPSDRRSDHVAPRPQCRPAPAASGHRFGVLPLQQSGVASTSDPGGRATRPDYEASFRQWESRASPREAIIPR